MHGYNGSQLSCGKKNLASSSLYVLCPPTGVASGTVSEAVEDAKCHYTITLYHDVGCGTRVQIEEGNEKK